MVGFLGSQQINPIPRGGGGIYAPPTTFRQFSPDVLIRGGSNYTLNLSCVITEHLKLVSGKKNYHSHTQQKKSRPLTLFYTAIFSRRTYPRRLQVYSKFKFCNYGTQKIGFGSNRFSYSVWQAVKVGWVVDFLLRFRLKIGYIFTFHEMR